MEFQSYRPGQDEVGCVPAELLGGGVDMKRGQGSLGEKSLCRLLAGLSFGHPLSPLEEGSAGFQPSLPQ